MTIRTDLKLLVTGSLVLLMAFAHGAGAQEIQYPSQDFARLDTFEAVAVEDADRLFADEDYVGAYAAYRAYSIEFAQGQALPYVLLRMGRCLHMAGRRNTAIRAYQDVVDYFPNDVRYAAAALYYIGQCHAQNGNEQQSLAVWANMVRDEDYVGQPNSGTALIALASAMQERGDFAEAAEYQWRTAVAFRESNRSAADSARDSVVYHYVIRAPNQERLLAFCNEVGGFRWQQNIEVPEESPVYWRHVLDLVLRSDMQDEKRVEVCRYWDAQMGDRFVENDDLRVKWFNIRLAYDRDGAAWGRRMDEQFRLQPTTIARVREWVGYYGNFPEARSAFFATHGMPLVAALETEDKLSLASHLHHPNRMYEEAHAVLQTVRTDGLDDATLSRLANMLANYEGEEGFLRIVQRIQDPVNAARTRFDYYYSRSDRNRENQEKALAEVAVLSASPAHAQEILWAHAVLRQRHGDYPEAIRLYQAANRQPQSTWAIIDCHVATQQWANAIELTNELQSLGGSVASAACLKAADIYRVSGDRGREVQQLQLVLRRYPGTGEASAAHNRLESYGVRLIGGESEAN